MKQILIQLDTDALASTFDRIVAVDAGVDEVFSYGGVTPDNVVPLIHGAIFTRGVKDLPKTAIFVGGSNVQAAEKVFAKAQQAFFGSLRVSLMLDPNGSATTAAAAVRSAARHLPLKDLEALILGGTGPVGQRCAQILAGQGAKVRVASRSQERAEATAAFIRNSVDGAQVTPCDCSDDGLAAAVDGVELIISAGAAGVQFLKLPEWQEIDSLKAIIDLNAVPPLGIEGVETADSGVTRGNVVCYGAMGIGALKMRIHRAAIENLFSSNDQVLETDAVFSLSQTLTGL